MALTQPKRLGTTGEGKFVLNPLSKSNQFKANRHAWACTNLRQFSIGTDTDDISLNHSKKILKSMKDLRKAAATLLADVEEEIQVLSMKLMPVAFYRGITSLPDEILQMILTEDVRTSDKPRVKILQLTCKRFNFIIKSSTDCWFLVTNYRRITKNQLLQLNTRRTSPIDVLDSYHGGIGRSFHEFVRHNTHRIRSLELEGNRRSGVGFNDIYKEGKDIVSVKSLKIRDYIGYPQWTFSYLLDLDCDLIPSPNSFPLLRHWNLRCARGENIHGRRVYVAHSGDKILDFLSSTPSLQSLCLSLDSDNLCSMSGFYSVTLCSVKSFTVNYRCYSRNNNKFMERLQLPQVYRVIFNAEAMHGLNTLFGPNTVLRTTRTLELNNVPVCEEKETIKEITLLQSYDEIHHIFPELERLDIRTQGYLFWYNRNAISWQNLHTVCFWHNSDSWKVNIEGLIVNRNFASRLKHLRIYGLPLEDTRSRRIDVSIRKILESAYEGAALEVQPGIMATEPDFEDLIHLRSQVGPTSMYH